MPTTTRTTQGFLSTAGDAGSGRLDAAPPAAVVKGGMGPLPLAAPPAASQRGDVSSGGGKRRRSARAVQTEGKAAAGAALIAVLWFTSAFL